MSVTTQHNFQTVSNVFLLVLPFAANIEFWEDNDSGYLGALYPCYYHCYYLCYYILETSD